ncbi:hypothetical protein GGI22_008072, partial [Coemansia erecta]
ALLHIDSSGGPDDRNSTGSKQSKGPPPPLNYICHSCDRPGHWIGDCPTRGQRQNKRQRTDDKPPPGYRCHQCKQSGHWRADCTVVNNDVTSSAAAAQESCWFCLSNPD